MQHAFLLYICQGTADSDSRTAEARGEVAGYAGELGKVDEQAISKGLLQHSSVGAILAG